MFLNHRYYCKRQHMDKVMTIGELRDLLEGPTRLLADRITRTAGAIQGTRPYWMRRRSELDAMIKDIGSPHIFFTFSAADIQWPDLHGHMPTPPVPPGDDERRKYQQRNRDLNSNPHIAAFYFNRRWEIFFEEVLKPKFDIVDFWYRFEWQHRGSSHIHGFAWVKDAPNLDELEKVLKPFAKAAAVAARQGRPLPALQITEVAALKEVEAFVEYWDPHVSTWSPGLHTDLPPAKKHPSSRDWTSLRDNLLELGELINRVQRHTKCQKGYCARRRGGVIPADEAAPGQPGLGPGEYCRFGYPKELLDKTQLIFNDKGLLEFLTKRNDTLLNPHNPSLILGWGANVDFKPIISKSSVVAYIAKYCSKAEKKSATYFDMLHEVLSDRRIDEDRAATKVVVQKMLSKFVVERDYSAQEVCHLLLKDELFHCSRTFQTLDLRLQRSGAIPEDFNLDEVVEEAPGDAPEDVAAPEDVLSVSKLERYEKRPEGEMDGVSLLECMRRWDYKPKEKVWKRRPRAKPRIVRVFPRYSSDPEDDSFEDWCRAKLQLHHPYRGSPANLQKDEDGEDIGFVRAYLERCLDASCEHPADPLPRLHEENDEESEDEDEDEDLEEETRRGYRAAWQRMAEMGPLQRPVRPRRYLGMRDLDVAHEWKAREEDVTEATLKLITTYINEQKKQAGGDDRELDPVDIAMLCGEQKRLFTKIVAHQDAWLRGHDPPPLRVHIDGTAGTGKSFTITAISTAIKATAHQSRRQPAPADVDNGDEAFELALDDGRIGLLRFAPSGIAAFNIKGETLHSGVSLPVTKSREYVELTPAKRLKLQERFKDVRYIILDEKSMIGQRTFGYFDRRLREIMRKDDFFGGLSILLFGDFGQLPPVGDKALYDGLPSSDLGMAGYEAYQSIKESITLRRMMRQQGEDPESVAFKLALGHLREQKVTMADCDLLAERALSRMSEAARAAFDGCLHLLTTNEEVAQYNEQALEREGKPVVRIVAKHTGGALAEKAEANNAGGLDRHLYIMEGAKVMLTANLWTAEGAYEP